MSTRPRVLITNAEERSMLAACRSLHEGGYDVTAASYTRLAPAQWSRACARRVRVANAGIDGATFLEDLRQELAHRPYATLLAGSDSSLLTVSQGRGRLCELTTLGLPDPSVVDRALSRESLAEAALGAGLTPADSIRCQGLEEVLMAGRELGFPVLIKSMRAASTNGRGVQGAAKSRVAASEAELTRRSRALEERVLVQRWVGNDVVSFGGVIAGGALLGVAVSRYRRMWPADSGSVAFSETVSCPPRLEDKVERLLAAIGWEGIFELELIQTTAGEFVPIDLNPRPYGSMALASAGGAPLAKIWCDWLLGHRPALVRARPGCRYRWETGDLRHAIWQLRRKRLMAAIAPLRPRRAVTHAYFKSSDPLPFFAGGLHLGERAQGKSIERLRRTQAGPERNRQPNCERPSAASQTSWQD